MAHRKFDFFIDIGWRCLKSLITSIIKKSNCRFQNTYALKLYEARRLKKKHLGVNVCTEVCTLLKTAS